MITLTGKKISEGIAIGKLSFYKRDTKEIRRIYVKDVEKEVMRFQKARQKALQELRDLYDSASKEVGEANAAIFEMQQMILEDQEIIRQITNIIVEHKLNAEYAVKNAVENVLASAAKSNKSYVQGHEADIKDVSTRVLRILARAWKDKMLTDEPFILASGELYPSEAVKLDKSKILGFVTRYGTINSHTAVLARTKGIPSVIGLGDRAGRCYIPLPEARSSLRSNVRLYLYRIRNDLLRFPYSCRTIRSVLFSYHHGQRVRYALLFQFQMLQNYRLTSVEFSFRFNSLRYLYISNLYL